MVDEFLQGIAAMEPASGLNEKLLAKMGYNVATAAAVVTKKYDGIGFICTENGLYTKSKKPIRNKQIQDELALLPLGIQGELISADEPDNFQLTSSIVMSESGSSAYKAMVYNCGHPKIAGRPYLNRLEMMKRLHLPSGVEVGEHIKVFGKEAWDYQAAQFAKGGEGAVIYLADCEFVHGRAKYQCWKYKPRKSLTASIVEINQGTGKYAITCGSITCKSIDDEFPFEEHFNVGSGFDDALRDKLWLEAASLIGQKVEIYFLEAGSSKRPRMPSFKGWMSC